MLKAFSSFLVAISKILSPDISWRKEQMFWGKLNSARVVSIFQLSECARARKPSLWAECLC